MRSWRAASGWLTTTCCKDGGRRRALFTRLAGLRNAVGLLAEECDQGRQRQIDNFPQAFSHLAQFGTAHNLLDASGPAYQRSAKTSATK